MIETRITKLLGTRYPIIQGGMAWVSSAGLVAAVSNAGGLGVLGSGSMQPDEVVAQIRTIKSLTDKPFGVNIMLMMPTAAEIVGVCISEKVTVVTTGAGNPGPYVKAFKDIGTRVIPVVPSVALARRLERSGVDAVIAEGNESGGHIGDITTMVLIPQVVDAVSIPVIAAGGIGDGRGIMAAMALGAEGVQMGTRFIVASECHAHPNYKKAIIQAKDRDTVATGHSTGHPVRVIRNKLAKIYIDRERQGASTDELDALARGSLQKSVRDGDIDNGSVMAGQVCGLIDREESAESIFKRLELDFFAVLGRVASYGNLHCSSQPTAIEDEAGN